MKHIKTIKTTLPVQFIREGDEFVAYCPALDISTSASSLEAVKKMFAELVEIFFGETLKMGTIDKVLHECGWRKVGKRGWHPPVREFITETQQEISIPCLT